MSMGIDQLGGVGAGVASPFSESELSPAQKHAEQAVELFDEVDMWTRFGYYMSKNDFFWFGDKGNPFTITHLVKAESLIEHIQKAADAGDTNKARSEKAKLKRLVTKARNMAYDVGKFDVDSKEAKHFREYYNRFIKDDEWRIIRMGV